MKHGKNKIPITISFNEHCVVNRTSQLWNKLPADALGTFPCKPSIFRKRVRKVISEVKGIEGGKNI
jgi:hypothetical protein